MAYLAQQQSQTDHQMHDVTDVTKPNIDDFQNENMFFALGHRRNKNDKEPKLKKVVT